MMTILHVAAGGALGAVARYAVVTAVHRGLGQAFPWGTLAVNVAGSFVMGIAAAWLLGSGARFAGWVPFAMVGFLGGFTTFSAFSLDLFRLLEAGAVLRAGAYVAGSVGLSFAALVAGIMLIRWTVS